MSSWTDRRSDLVSEMYWAVAEQAHLWEITSGAIDHLANGDQVIHGPWTHAECQSVLEPWLLAGWIDLIADAELLPTWKTEASEWRSRAILDGEFVVLAREDAQDLLSESGRWSVETDDGGVMLCRSDEGERHPFAEWSGG